MLCYVMVWYGMVWYGILFYFMMKDTLSEKIFQKVALKNRPGEVEKLPLLRDIHNEDRKVSV